MDGKLVESAHTFDGEVEVTGKQRVRGDNIDTVLGGEEGTAQRRDIASAVLRRTKLLC